MEVLFVVKILSLTKSRANVVLEKKQETIEFDDVFLNGMGTPFLIISISRHM